MTNDYITNKWSFTSFEKIIDDKNISNNEFSFKFYQTNLESNTKHFYSIYENNKVKLYFHGVCYDYKKFKIIDSTYSGFIIPNIHKKYYIKNSFIINKNLSKFLKKSKFSILILRPYPLKIFFNDLSLPHESNFKGIKENNGYIILKKNFFTELSYNQKREINLGLKNISKYNLVTEKSDNCLDILKKLLKMDLKKKIDIFYIEKIYENSQKGLYRIRILLNDDFIICVLIISVRPGISTQTFNYTSPDYKKDFINKGIHFLMINELFEKNIIDLFVFGDSIDNNDGMKSVTAFKQSFSKLSLLSLKIYHPLNIYGYLFIFLKYIRSLFKYD